MTRVTSGHSSNINRITPDPHRLGHETGQNRVKPVIRSRHGHISHGYMKFTRKDVISSGARPADFISSDVRASQVEDRRLDAEGAGPEKPREKVARR